jgi:hypothetical protein
MLLRALTTLLVATAVMPAPAQAAPPNAQRLTADITWECVPANPDADPKPIPPQNCVQVKNCPNVPDPDPLPLFSCYSFVERYLALPVKEYPRQVAAAQRYPLVQVQIPQVYTGDILMIQGAVQVTNNLAYSVELACRLIYSGNSGEIIGTDQITKEIGYNVTPQLQERVDRDLQGNVTGIFKPLWRRTDAPGTDAPHGLFMGEHHGYYPFSGTFIVPSTAANRYVTLVCYAGGATNSGANDWITVDKQGQMTVVRLY